MYRRFSCLVHVGIVLSCLTASHAAVVFVDGRAPVCGDGQSWPTAYKYLQDALTAARIPGSGITEIWVAAGTYQPDRDCTNPTGTGARTATFQLVDGVALRGGFAGTEDPIFFDPATRDFETSKTILSGDLAGNDGPNFTNNVENSNNVVIVDMGGESIVLDGFTISGGHSSSGTFPYFGGGGLYAALSSVTLTDCTFSGNWAYVGGGAFMSGGSFTLTRCLFTGNWASNSGGGLWNSADSVLTDCTFSDNSATHGGGMDSSNSPTLTHCVFNANSASSRGGGLRNSGGHPKIARCMFSSNSANYGGGIHSSPGSTGSFTCNDLTLLSNCVLVGNSASVYGGGLYSRVQVACSNPLLTLINCSISGNTAASGGGGIYLFDGNPAITNCILWGNGSTQIDGPATVAYSCIQGGWSGVGNIDSDPLFTGLVDGNLRLQARSPCIDAGDNTAVPVDVTTDLAGGPRFVDAPARIDTGNGVAPIVDMGAYEFVKAADDLDGDGFPDSSDNCPTLANFDQTDVDQDGVGDACDVCPNTIPGATVSATGCPIGIPGDFDRDGDVDLIDFAHLQVCLKGGQVAQTESICQDAKLNADSYVDQTDVGIFLGCLSGSGIPADPNCAD